MLNEKTGLGFLQNKQYLRGQSRINHFDHIMSDKNYTEVSPMAERDILTGNLIIQKWVDYFLQNRELLNSKFDHFCRFASEISGRAVAFNCALGIIIFWMLSGPLFGFSDTWQLIINTATTIVTFLMVFLIQHTQNRENQAIHVKLDELIRAQEGARNDLLDLEILEEKELKLLHEYYVSLAKNARTQPTGDTGNT